ncbi:hypothetical protein [Rhizobium sp. BK376]|uniref:hypothetical protein n=1 Tax=Rhizobium sp. BK376 TaxID=2512149 RepID=UPI00104B12C4|nr:hypothetical protein [Rhizobium sp. BK376]
MVTTKAEPLPAQLPRRSKAQLKPGKIVGLATKATGGMSGATLFFLVMVVLPTVIGSLYFAFLASPQYMSEFRFSVRPTDGANATTSVAAETALAMSNSFIVSDYVMSRDAVTELDKSVGIRKFYTRDGVDFLSRLANDASTEQLVKYWSGRVSTNYDLATGINTVQVTAFTPQDAYTIASALQILCEKLVNDISEKARQTQMAFSKAELDRAEARLKDVRAQETALRTGQRTLDARKEAEGKIALNAKMRGDLADLQAEYSSLSSYMKPSSPRLSLLKNQIAAAQEQIDRLQSQIGGTEGTTNGDTLDDAQLVTKYDQLQSDVDIATKLYQSSLTSYEAARMQASNNQIYLATYVHPGVPEIATYPRKVLDSFLVFITTLGVWIVLKLVYYSVRDHA